MGKAKEKRPLLLPEGFQGASTSVFSMSSGGAMVVGGTLTGSSNASVAGTFTGSSNATISGTVTASSAFKHAVTTSSSQLALTSVGVNVLSATGAVSYTLPAAVAGLRMILAKTANSTAILTVDTASTAQTLDGSSATKITLDGLNQKVELVGVSTSRWLVLSSTTVFGGIST